MLCAHERIVFQKRANIPKAGHIMFCMKTNYVCRTWDGFSLLWSSRMINIDYFLLFMRFCFYQYLCLKLMRQRRAKKAYLGNFTLMGSSSTKTIS